MAVQTNDLYIGVDIGGTRTKSGLVDIQSGEVLESIVHSTERFDAGAFMQQVQSIVQQFSSKASLMGAHIAGIGFGIPGFTTAEGTIVTTYGFVEFMENYPIAKIIGQECMLPCLVDNDARVVALGEALYGLGKTYERVLTLTLGTGLGFGLVVNGKFTTLRPLSHMGGHMTITGGNDRCYCGKTGCLEALVSAAGIVNAAKPYSDVVPTALGVFQAAEQGHEGAASIVNKIIQYLHIGIGNYVNLFAPDIVILGGGIAKGLRPYANQIKGYRPLSPYPEYDFQLGISNLQEMAGMTGSAALFLQKVK